MIKVLFVCLGNICRSPSAEGVFKKIVEENNLDDKIFIDSAGTSAYHVGERADSRMRKHASKRFYNLTSRSRQFVHNDFIKFDYIIAMDNSNYIDILKVDRGGEFSHKVKMMNDFSREYFSLDVPDPYYGGSEGFETVLDMLEESCSLLLNFIKEEHNL